MPSSIHSNGVPQLSALYPSQAGLMTPIGAPSGLNASTAAASPALGGCPAAPPPHPTYMMLPALAIYSPPVGSTAAARRRVHELGRQVDKELGFWGRNWVKITAPTLLGLIIGIPQRRLAAARASSALQPQLQELSHLKQIVKQVPKKERSKAQRALLADLNTRLRQLQPTASSLTQEVLKSIAAVTLGLTVSVVVLSLGVGIGIAAGDGDVMTGALFIPYGLPDLSGARASTQNPVDTLKGDELPLSAALPAGYKKPLALKTARWA